MCAFPFLQIQIIATGNCLQRNLNSIWMSLMAGVWCSEGRSLSSVQGVCRQESSDCHWRCLQDKTDSWAQVRPRLRHEQLVRWYNWCLTIQYYPTTKKPTWNMTAKRFLTEDIISCKVWVKSSSNIILSFTSLPSNPAHSGALIKPEETVVFTPDSE